MKLKNSALQELYDTFLYGPVLTSTHKDSPIDEAFRECDDKLSDSATFACIQSLEKRNDILKKSELNLLETNIELVNKKRQLEKEIEELQIRAHQVEDEIDDAKKQLNYFTHSRDDWRSRAKYAEDEVKELKETLEKANADRTELQKDRDSYHDLYTELSKTYDKLSEENRKLNARTDCLRMEVEWYRKHYKEKSDKIQELKSTLNSMCGDEYIKKLQDSVSKNCYDQGQTDLWVKLQDVKDMQPNEFDPECECLGDVIDMDLEDFLDAYKKWQEEKEKERLDHMRDYLARFCQGRLCRNCPLYADEFMCGRAKGFPGIPDEELEKYYEKARDYNKRAWHGDATAEKIKEACDAFAEGLKAGLASEVKEVPVSCDIPIKDLASWECTIEATVEINKDLLEKVCGVKPEEEEHKLEYGDAVRLPWRDYDYMYIGPDEKEETIVRLFDPKNHAIATTHIGNVRYNGGKIIICDEDDLRKIWKDKK